MKSRLFNIIVKMIAAGLGTGYCPVTSGTVGSLLGIAVFFLIAKTLWGVKILVLAALYIFGTLSAGYAERVFGKKDSKKIVIDEIAGCVLFLLFIPETAWCAILGFIIYRILDIIKPFPADISQRLKGGLGIMADDLIAAIYTVFIINIIFWIRHIV